MEGGTDARAFLAKAAATFAVLSLLPVALSGSAPSHASAALRTISSSDFGAVPIGDVPWSTSLFASFTYEHGVAFGTYAQFGYNATGTTVFAHLASPDLLVFKSVPAGSTNKAEWRAVLDAISAGHVVSELDLVAIADGGWMQNPGRYRIDVATWPLAVRAGQASVQVDTLRPGGAVVLLAFDSNTMPAADPTRLIVRANGNPVNRSNDTLTLFYAPDSLTRDASYSLLPLRGTVIALYLPSLAAVSVEVVSVPPPAPNPAFDPGSEASVVAALAIVSVAAARMLRRREE